MTRPPIAAISQHLRDLAGFRLANGFPMFPCNIIDGYKDHEPIKIRLYVTHVLWDHCRYRNSYNALTLGNKNTTDRDRLERQNSVGVVNHFAARTTVPCPMIEDFMIPVHNWDANEVKSSCFDYYELYSAYQIKSNLGAGVGIVPLFHDKNVMRDYIDKMEFGQQF